MTVGDMLNQSPKNLITDFSEIYGLSNGFKEKEGICYLKTNSNSMKEYYVNLVGSDIFFNKHKGDKKHKLMHCLVGAFVSKKTQSEDFADHPFSIKIQIGTYQSVKARKMFF